MTKREMVALSGVSLSEAEWRRAIAEADFLASISLDRLQPDKKNGVWHASVGGESVTFRFDVFDATTLVRGRGDLRAYRFAASAPNSAPPRSVAAGLVALSAYVSRTSGILFAPGLGETFPAGKLKKIADAMLAIAIGLEDDYVVRYPEDRTAPPGNSIIKVQLGE